MASAVFFAENENVNKISFFLKDGSPRISIYVFWMNCLNTAILT